MTAEEARTRQGGGEQDLVACYVYGVVPEAESADEFEDLPAVGDPEERVTCVRYGEVAAVVSEVRTDRPLGTPQDLRAHAGVLDSLAGRGAPVLPFRFGTVMKDAKSVAQELLAEGHDRFLTALDQLRGRAQFLLRAEYEQEAVLREVLEEQPEAAQLRQTVAEVPEDAAYFERIRLGEMVAEAVARKREADSAALERALAPLALGAAAAEPVAEDGVADVSFLVEDARRDEFAEAAEDLARRWHGRIRLRLLGPLAAYDFAADALAAGGEG